MRVRVVLFVACMAAACGGSSTPTQPGALPAANITTGVYKLTLTMSPSGDPVCTGSGCISMSLCISSGGVQPIAVIVPIEVHVERAGDDLEIRPQDTSATFRMNLRINGPALSGTASGQVRSGGIVVAVNGGTSQSAAIVAGSAAAAPVLASGTLDGTMTIGGAGCSNNAHRWSLTR